MRSTFMAGSVQGTKSEIKKANKTANIISLVLIIGFVIALFTVLASTGAFAQELEGAEVSTINMMDEIEKPFQTVLDNLELDPNVNTVENGTNRYGYYYIKATYYGTGNIVTHTFSKKNSCISVEYRSTNFRSYSIMLQILNDTFNSGSFTKIKKSEKLFNIDTKVTRNLWFIKIKKQ